MADRAGAEEGGFVVDPGVAFLVFDDMMKCPTLAGLEVRPTLEIVRVRAVYGKRVYAEADLEECRITLYEEVHSDDADVVQSIAHELVHFLPGCLEHTPKFKRRLMWLMEDYLEIALDRKLLKMKLGKLDATLTQVIRVIMEEGREKACK